MDLSLLIVIIGHIELVGSVQYEGHQSKAIRVFDSESHRLCV